MRIGIGTSIVGQGVAGEVEPAFVTTWETTTASESIALPLVSTGTYDFNVDWGDGTSDTITAYDQAEVTHTYATADTYTVSITGTIEGWQFNNAGDRLKIKTLDSYGPLVLTTNGAFYGCSNLTSTATDAPTISTTDLQNTFRSCTNFNGAIGNWNVSSVTNLNRTFRDAFAFNQDISGWNVSSVTIIQELMRGTNNFNQNLGGWDVSNVQNMNSAFNDADGMSAANLGAVKDWTIAVVSVASNFMDACTNSMSTSDYDELLVNWEAQDPNTGVSIDFNNATYTAGGLGDTARTSLTTATPTGYGWTILDGGSV